MNLKTLAALAFPGVGFAVLIATTGVISWEMAIIGVAGGIATGAGYLDWRFHRSGAVVIGAPEHRAHFLALAIGGGSLFVCMAIASMIERPLVMLLPVIMATVLTTVLICFDELIYHRRRKPSRYEAALHRTLIFGNGLAFLAWAHFCFVRSAGV